MSDNNKYQITPKQEKEAKEKFQIGMDHATEEQLDDAIKSGEEKVEKLEKKSILPKGLSDVWDNIKLLLAISKDYSDGSYKDIPWISITAIVSAILYFVSPIDAILDFIPFIGYLDDATVITVCLNWINSDLEKYRVWKEDKGYKPKKNRFI